MRVLTDQLLFPEGPVCLKDGSVLVVEIRRKTLTRVWPDGRVEVVAKLGGGPNGAAIGPDGHCYVANNGGFSFAQRADGVWVSSGTPTDYIKGRIERVNLATGAFEEVYDQVSVDGDMEPIRGPNDLVFDAHGGFYFTDPGKTRHRTMDRGKICYAKADGSLIRELVAPIYKPNGIGLSPDGMTLYSVETETARLWAWDLAEPGKFARPASASPSSPHGSRLLYTAPSYMRFDSLAVEANGNICIGTLDVGGITVCSPEGELVEFVSVPGDTHCTNICFGGVDMKKAYVTQSYAGRLVELDWARPGLKLFCEA